MTTITPYVSREQWGAILPIARLPMRPPVENIVIHYDFTEVEKCMNREDCEDTMRDLQRMYIRQKGCDDLPFNFLVGGDGAVYEGRGWHSQPEKTLPLKEYKGNRIDIAYLGDYRDGSRMTLCFPIMQLMEHGVVMKYVQEDYCMTELPDEDKLDNNPNKPKI